MAGPQPPVLPLPGAMPKERPKPANIFSQDAPGEGGIWHGRGSTKTKPSSTLFVANVPLGLDLSQVEALFSQSKGFFCFRSVRRLSFVDYVSTEDATRAMRTYQGYRFPGYEGQDGIMIDYDKDPKAKRNREYKKVVRREESQLQNDMESIYCDACGLECLRIKLPEGKKFDALPKRKTDGSIVVDTVKHTCRLKMKKGDAKAIKRETGTEKQYRMVCRNCGVFLAYASIPFEQWDPDLKYIFMLKDLVTDKPKKIIKLPKGPKAAEGEGEDSHKTDGGEKKEAEGAQNGADHAKADAAQPKTPSASLPVRSPPSFAPSSSPSSSSSSSSSTTPTSSSSSSTTPTERKSLFPPKPPPSGSRLWMT